MVVFPVVVGVVGSLDKGVGVVGMLPRVAEGGSTGVGAGVEDIASIGFAPSIVGVGEAIDTSVGDVTCSSGFSSVVVSGVMPGVDRGVLAGVKGSVVGEDIDGAGSVAVGIDAAAGSEDMGDEVDAAAGSSWKLTSGSIVFCTIVPAKSVNAS